MKIGRMLAGMGVLLFAALTASAQQKTPGNLISIEFQTPKNGMVAQYEAGRKAKVQWHKKQNDSQPLVVWQIISGDNTGTYLVERVGQHWADFDTPSVPDAADLEEYNKEIGGTVEHLVTRYYEHLAKISTEEMSGMPPKFLEAIIFQVKPGHDADFYSAISRINEGGKKTNWPSKYSWYTLANGGQDGQYVLTFGRKNWAEFEEKPDVKPFREMLKEAFGQAETDSILHQLDSSIEKSTSEIVQFRDDLSYMPAK